MQYAIKYTKTGKISDHIIHKTKIGALAAIEDRIFPNDWVVVSRESRKSEWKEESRGE